MSQILIKKQKIGEETKKSKCQSLQEFKAPCEKTNSVQRSPSTIKSIPWPLFLMSSLKNKLECSPLDTCLIFQNLAIILP